MHILENINTYLFKDEITRNFSNNISVLTCSTLANMISIDYLTRLNSEPEAKQYISHCIDKLKIFLGTKVINDDNFSVALTLFAVAITEEDNSSRSENNILEQSQDAIIDNLININFGNDKNLSYDDKKVMKEIFRSLLAEKNSSEVMNYMQSDPQTFRSNVLYAIKKYPEQSARNLYICTEINKILSINLALDKKVNLFKQTASKVISAACALAVGALSVATAGAAFSILAIPVAIFSIKYAPKIGEKIGQIILNKDSNIKAEINKVEKLKDETSKSNLAFLEKQKVIEKQRHKSQAISLSPLPKVAQGVVQEKSFIQR